MNRELILAELRRSRDALNKAIAYAEAESATTSQAIRAKSVKIGESRAVAILSSLRDAGGRMAQREFEDICLRNCRTLVGAGGFIARGSILRHEPDANIVEYEITDKGIDTVDRWEARYGKDWAGCLEDPGLLASSEVMDHQKVRLLV